jgi:hypothetical protein
VLAVVVRPVLDVGRHVDALRSMYVSPACLQAYRPVLDLARHPNVMMKISDVSTAARRQPCLW